MERNKRRWTFKFILPLENIEIIQNINKSRNNLLDINLSILLKEYSNKNIALAFMKIVNLVEENLFKNKNTK